MAWYVLEGLLAAANRVENGLIPTADGLQRTLAILPEWLLTLAQL